MRMREKMLKTRGTQYGRRRRPFKKLLPLHKIYSRHVPLAQLRTPFRPPGGYDEMINKKSKKTDLRSRKLIYNHKSRKESL